MQRRQTVVCKCELRVHESHPSERTLRQMQEEATARPRSSQAPFGSKAASHWSNHARPGTSPGPLNHARATHGNSTGDRGSTRQAEPVTQGRHPRVVPPSSESARNPGSWPPASGGRDHGACSPEVTEQSRLRRANGGALMSRVRIATQRELGRPRDPNTMSCVRSAGNCAWPRNWRQWRHDPSGVLAERGPQSGFGGGCGA